MIILLLLLANVAGIYYGYKVHPAKSVPQPVVAGPLPEGVQSLVLLRRFDPVGMETADTEVDPPAPADLALNEQPVETETALDDTAEAMPEAVQYEPPIRSPRSLTERLSSLTRAVHDPDPVAPAMTQKIILTEAAVAPALQPTTIYDEKADNSPEIDPDVLVSDQDDQQDRQDDTEDQSSESNQVADSPDINLAQIDSETVASNIEDTTDNQFNVNNDELILGSKMSELVYQGLQQKISTAPSFDMIETENQQTISENIPEAVIETELAAPEIITSHANETIEAETEVIDAMGEKVERVEVAIQPEADTSVKTALSLPVLVNQTIARVSEDETPLLAALSGAGALAYMPANTSISPQNAGAEKNTKKIMAVSAKTAVISPKQVMPVAKPAKVSPTLCYRSELFNEQQKANRALQWWRKKTKKVQLKSEQKKTLRGTLLYLPAFSSRNAAKQAQNHLDSVGITDHRIMQNPANAIAVGVFKKTNSIKQRLDELRLRGYHTVQQQPRYQTSKQYYLMIQLNKKQNAWLSSFNKTWHVAVSKKKREHCKG